MGVGEILNIILGVALFLFTVRDIVGNTIEKDFSGKKYPLIARMFLSSKEQVVARNFIRALGFSNPDDFRRHVNKKKSGGYIGAIEFLSKCIIKAASDDTPYQFGGDDDPKHESLYFVDSQGFAQKRENCIDLYRIMLYLIHKVNRDRDYGYVFSIKGGNIPLATAFFMDDYNILSVVPKERNEIVDSGSPNDFIVNYEGFNSLHDKAKQNGGKEIKGIAITCNLSDGGTFLNHIKAYNDKIAELQKSGDVPKNIKKVESVYILYRAIDGGKLDEKFNAVGIKCYRYFDLSEDAKECLYSMKDKKLEKNEEFDKFPCYKCIRQKRKPKDCTAKHCYRKLR